LKSVSRVTPPKLELKEEKMFNDEQKRDYLVNFRNFLVMSFFDDK